VSAKGSASGKVILLGEHAVVYGAPALAAGIDRGASAEAVLAPSGGGSEIRIAELGGGETAEIHRAFEALLAEGDALPATRVEARLDVPPYAGLGSSAALGVAVARAALGASGRPITDADAIARATAWERTFHGNPSGIDTTAAAIGGCFRFTRAGGAKPLLPAQSLTLCVGLTGVATSTKEMVEGVARLRAHKPEVVDRAISGITALVENAALAIEAGDVTAVGKLMDLNQMLLAGLMLSTEVIEDLCGRARRAGALGAKLTGKGGGGSVIALVADAAAAEAVVAAWRDGGYEAFATRIASRNER
jgi:mevalonate kinase